jgi:hypothetical protein
MNDGVALIMILGRLDRFCLSTMASLWPKIPHALRILLNLTRISGAEDTGWDALQALVSPATHRVSIVVSRNLMPPESLRERASMPTIYLDSGEARKALGNPPMSESWRVKISRA